MKKVSLKYGFGLAVLAALVVTIPVTWSQAAQKPTLLRGARSAPEGPTQRMYFESLSQDEGKLRALRADLIAAGASQVNTFLPSVIVCEIPQGVDVYGLVKDADISIAPESFVDDTDESAPIFSREWVKRRYREAEELAKKPVQSAPGEPTEPPESFVRRVPDEVVWRNAREVQARGDAAADVRLIFQNSEILSGDILINLIFPESQSASENWKQGEIDAVYTAAFGAITFYQQTYRRANVSIYMRKPGTTETAVEPITYTIGGDSVWVSDVMSHLGYPGAPSRYLESVHAYNNAKREYEGTDWVFTLFVVRSFNSPGYKFKDARATGIFYLGGPCMAIPYPAGQLGTYWLAQGLRHGLSIMFWGLSEQIGIQSNCPDNSGYLDYEHGNKTIEFDPIFNQPKKCDGGFAEFCVGNPTDMFEWGYDGPPCKYTEGMMGAIDELNPSANVIDAFEAPPVIDFGSVYAETLTAEDTELRFTVTAGAVSNQNSKQPEGLRRDYAAAIREVRFSIGGVGPFRMYPSDGIYDELVESFDFDVPLLMPGSSDLVLTASNTYGAKADYPKQVVYLGLDYYGFRFDHKNRGLGFSWYMRGETFAADFELHRIDYGEGGVDSLLKSNLTELRPKDKNGLTPYYYFDGGASPGHEYGYYVNGSFDVLYKGSMKTFTEVSDTFHTVVAFPREGGILSMPSPNPFNPPRDGKVWISVSVPVEFNILTSWGAPTGGPQRAAAQNDDTPDPVAVTIGVYDVLGRRVKSLYQNRVLTTVVSVTWDGTNQYGTPVPSGMYFVKAKAGASTGSKKVLVLR